MIQVKANRYNFLITFFVALGSFTYGFNSSIVASVLGLESFFKYFDINANTSRGTGITGAINGVYTAGGALGCWSVCWLADILGRKRCIQVVCVVCIISAALQTGSVHIAMFLVGRFFNGFGVGMINSIVPTYQSELAPPSQRGRLVGSHGVMIVTGYATAGYTVYGVYFEKNPAIQWRLCLAIQIVAPLLLLLGSPWLPESPHWLVSRGRYDEGRAIIQRLRQTSHGTDDSNITAEYEIIKSQIQLEATDQVNSIWGMLSRPTLRKRLLLGFFLQCIAQSTGVLVVFNYQISLYANLGLHGSLPLLLLALYNTVAATMNYVNSLLVDRIGRIKIMAVGIVCAACAMSVYTALFAQYANTSNRVGNGLAIAFLFLFVFFYGSSLDATTYIYCSEIFPTQYRARGVGVSVSGLFIANIVYTQAAPTAFAHIGWRYYLVFIIVPMFGLGFLLKFYPETKGLSVAEMAGKFGDTVAPETIVEVFPPEGRDEKHLEDSV